jgi:protein-S-isoprenylcysteine O-methyltransferase Ste14
LQVWRYDERAKSPRHRWRDCAAAAAGAGCRRRRIAARPADAGLCVDSVVVVVLLGAGCWLGFVAVNTFRLAGTHVEPWKPSTALVNEGIYTRMRNPMYVGGILILVALAILLASDWTLVLTILFVPVIHFGVVLREERYLAAKFGEPYQRYLKQVPRYGWPY